MAKSAERAETRLFLTVWLVYLLFIYVKPESISGQMVDLAMSVVDNGNVYLRYSTEYKDTSFYDGHYLCGHFPGAAVPVVPLYLLSKPFLRGLEGRSRYLVLHLLSIIFISTVLGALTVVVFHNIVGDIGLAGRDRLLLTFLFAFGTMNLNYSTSLYKVNQVSFYLLCAFFILFRARMEGQATGARYLWVGLLLAGGAITHPPYVFICLVLLGYAHYVGGFKKGLMVLASGSISTILLFLYLKIAFGAFLADPYAYRVTPPSFTLSFPRWQNVLYMLLSPKEGLFIYAPVLLLSVWGAAKYLRGHRLRPEAIVTACASILTCLFFSGYVVSGEDLRMVSAHDASIPIRFLAPICPYLMLLGAHGISRIRSSVLYVLGGWSVFFSYLGAQAGFLPGPGGTQLGYALKVWITGTGMSSLFAQTLPRLFGVDTLSTYTSRPDIAFAELFLKANREQLIALLRNQLIFVAAFLAVVTLLLMALRRLWKGMASAAD